MGRYSWKQNGFTLVELMIVMIIISILAAIAYPAYARYVRNTEESRAQGQMMAAVAAAETWRAQRFSYAGYTLPANITGSDRYQFQVTLSNSDRAMTITARPTGTQTGMGAMAINHRGQTCINKNSDTTCTIGTHATWDD